MQKWLSTSIVAACETHIVMSGFELVIGFIEYFKNLKIQSYLT
jgi:hypothetical protein